MEHDIENHSKTPNITFMIENIFLSTFWTLILIKSDFPPDLFLLIEFSRIAKSTNFDDFIFNEK